MLAGAGADVLAELCASKRVLVIGDEIHRGGMGNPWGDAIVARPKRPNSASA